MAGFEVSTNGRFCPVHRGLRRQILSSAAQVPEGKRARRSVQDIVIASCVRRHCGSNHRVLEHDTAIVAVALLGSLSYLTGNDQVVSGFARAGYPQHLRIVLGIMKPMAAIVLLVPGLGLLKEWAYAGITFAWVMALISARASGESTPVWIMPLVLLGLLVVSYVTRPASRRVATASTGR